MKILLSVLVAMVSLLAQPVAAGPWRDFGGGPLPRVQAQRDRTGGMQRPPQRDFRRVEEPPERRQRPDGRLTEEERRELRRDIDRANREIYKGR